MIKYIDFNTEDPGVEVTPLHPGILIKTAGYAPELKEFLDNLESSPGKYFLHINALGAGEYFSSNRNGDYFPEIALQEYHKTFETNANLYRHHKNKPQLGHKIFGRVAYAFYNKEMHRVELIVEFDTKTAPDLKSRIDQGEHLAFSMGARVKYDECSICGNKAKKITDYCTHLRHQMGQTLSDGRKVYAINRFPKFFDISFVTIPADKTAYMFSKVASLNEDTEDQEIENLMKQAENEKNADIIKRIPTTALLSASEDPKRLIVDSQPEMPKEMIDTLSKHSLEKVLSTLMALHIMPRRRDFQRLVLTSRGNRALSDDLDSRDEVFSVPKNIEPVMPDDLRPKACPNIIDSMYPHQDYLKRAPLTKPVIVVRIMEKMAAHQEGSKMEQELRLPDLGDRFSYETLEVRPEAPIKNPLLALTGLSGLYYGYAGLLNKFRDAKGLEALLLKKPWLMPLVIGGASLASIKAQESFNKQANFDPGALARMLIAVPATYAYSGHQEGKVQKGEPVSFYGNTVRKHPLLMGVLHGWMAGKAGKLMNTMSKTAEVEQRITDAFLELPNNKFDDLYQIVVNT